MFHTYYYLLENSFKQLMRTKGMVPTFILATLVSIMSFFSFNVFFFFQYLHTQMVEALEEETDFIVAQMSMAPVMGMFLFKIATCLISILLLFLTLGYIKRSFTQFLVSHKEELRIMSLLGETTQSIALFNTMQVMVFSFGSILLGSLVGQQIFFASVIKTIQLGVDSENVNRFNGNVGLTVIMICLSLLYVCLTSFLSFHKKVESFVL